MKMEPSNGWENSGKPPKFPVTGVLLAGGCSRRFGSPKALATWRGRTFSQHLLKRLELQCEEVLVSANDTGMFEGVAYRLIPDRVRDKGPLAGLLAVMEESRYPWLLVVSCDMPLVDRAAQKLLQESAKFSGQVVCYRDHQRLYPFPGLYHQDLLGNLGRWLNWNKGKVTEFIGRLPSEWKQFLSLEKEPLSIQKEFHNVNRREDLELLEPWAI